MALAYSSNETAAAELAKELQQIVGDSRRVTTHRADLSIPEEALQLCAVVEAEHKRSVDILLSNAGYGKRIRDVS